MKSVKNFIADVNLSLLFTHVCPATGFCRCCAFQIGKICCQNCIQIQCPSIFSTRIPYPRVES